jgi:transposase
MIHLTCDTQILLATEPADFRCGIDGFAAKCRQQLEHNPRNGVLFVFINRNKTMVRGLCYDGTGFWLMTKRLSEGRFKGWPKSGEVCTSVIAQQLRTLLSGQAPDWSQVV